jgi:hypothetical protein
MMSDVFTHGRMLHGQNTAALAMIKHVKMQKMTSRMFLNRLKLEIFMC